MVCLVPPGLCVTLKLRAAIATARIMPPVPGEAHSRSPPVCLVHHLDGALRTSHLRKLSRQANLPKNVAFFF